VVVRDHKARRLFPDIHPFDYQTSVELALARLESGEVETMWTDALMTTQGDVPPVVLTTLEGLNLEHRQLVVPAPPGIVYCVFAGLGGTRGWLYLNWVWHLRGLLDRLAGGVGLRRGRRDPNDLRVGDALDFWRVEAVARPLDPTARRDEGARPGLAAVPRASDIGLQLAALPNGLLRAEGRVGSALLVWPVSHPQDRVRHDP
jgi:hypothetical protein